MAVIVWAVVLTYAIWQRRFLDIRWAATRTIVYFLSLATIFGFLVLGCLVVTSYIPYGGSSASIQIYYIVTLTFLVVVFEHVRHFFNYLTNEVFFHRDYEPEEVLDRLGRLIADTVDLDHLMTSSATLLRNALKAQAVELLAIDRDGQVVAAVTQGRKIDDGMLGKDILKEIDGPMVIADSYNDQPSHLQQALAGHGVAVALCMRTHREVTGYLLVGYKQAGQLFTREDVALLRGAVSQLAVGLQNALRFREIRQFNVTLQQKVRDATAQLQRSNRKLRELDAAKDEFMSLASHQLRTPLTTIRGYLSMALEGDAGRLNTEQLHFLRQASIASRRMAFLIADFLNVSRLKTGKFVLERRPTNLRTVIAGEIDQLTATAANRKVALVYDEPPGFPSLNVDGDKLAQVVMNFIDNAIYYTPEGGTITVLLSTEHDRVIFKVVDTGIGVPPSEQAQLFTKFYRATNARQARPDGTGIGLFMAKEIIALHGGSLIFESSLGKGSTFGFSLPIGRTKAAEG